MSGRQMAPASLAIGIALNPGILLLDEPTANLDIATRREILTVLEEMKDIIQTAVIATHDMQLVCQWADRIVVLCGGKVVADGPQGPGVLRPGGRRLVGIRPPEIFTMAQALDEPGPVLHRPGVSGPFSGGKKMEKLTKKLSESILDKFSMDFLRNQVLKNAYGNDDTVIAAPGSPVSCWPGICFSAWSPGL